MFVKPRSAFVGWPSVVCSSSGRAKKARYARLLPSTRKSSESCAGPSSRTSSSPVSVFGTRPSLCGAYRDPNHVPVRRERAVALEHAGRDQELDGAAVVVGAFDDVGRRLGEG